MNVKLAWEIGWKLGMAKRAGGVYGKLMEPVRAPMKQTLGAISKATVGPSGGAGVTPAIAAKQKAEADTLAKAGPLSLDSDDGSDDWDEKSPLSLDSVGGSDDGDENGPLSLDSGGGTHRRNIQLYGVDAANRMKAGGRQPGGGPSKAEQGFWGGPKFGDMQRYWLQMLGKTPSQLSGEDVAREAGYGRALQHKQNLDWIKSMLMGPQMGHYGMGG